MNVVSATDLRLIEKPDFLTGEGDLDAGLTDRSPANGSKEWWDGADISRSESSSVGTFQVEVAHLPKGERDCTGRKAARVRCEILGTLGRYCFCSPVPIWYDGVSITELLRDPNCGIPGAMPLLCLPYNGPGCLPRLTLTRSESL